MKEKRIFIILGGVVVTVILLIFAGILSNYSREETVIKYSKSQKEQVEISITYATGDATWNSTMEMVVEAFMEENKDIQVTLRDDGADTRSGMYSDYLKKEIALSNLGDIVEIRDNSLFVNSNILSPLPNELTELVQCNADEKGNVYVLPEVVATQGIIYNKDLFEKLDLQEPETYDEFLQICEKLKKYKLIPIVVGAKDQWHIGFWLNHFFRTMVIAKNPDWENQRTNGLVSWTDEEPKEMIIALQNLFESGYINTDYLTVSDSETALLMAEGNVGMLYSGPWMYQKIKEIDSECSLGWFYLPDEEGNRYVFLDKSSGWAITENCRMDTKKYEAVKHFLKFFYRRDIYQKICSYNNSIPSTKEEIELSDILMLHEVQKKMKDHVVLMENQVGDKETPENFRGIMYERLFNMLQGKITRDKFLEEMDVEWEKCSQRIN